MSEMLANQFFISGRYFEALEEYSKLPEDKLKDPLIMKKMIICAALNKNFKKALELLENMPNDATASRENLRILKDECLCEQLLKDLETRTGENQYEENVIKMQIAILSYFTDKEKSLQYFNKLNNFNFSNLTKEFLKIHSNKTTQ